MRPAAKLAAFALVLAVVFGLGTALGAAAGPLGQSSGSAPAAGHMP